VPPNGVVDRHIKHRLPLQENAPSARCRHNWELDNPLTEELYLNRKELNDDKHK